MLALDANVIAERELVLAIQSQASEENCKRLLLETQMLAATERQQYLVSQLDAKVASFSNLEKDFIRLNETLKYEKDQNQKYVEELKYCRAAVSDSTAVIQNLVQKLSVVEENLLHSIAERELVQKESYSFLRNIESLNNEKADFLKSLDLNKKHLDIANATIESFQLECDNLKSEVTVLFNQIASIKKIRGFKLLTWINRFLNFD